MLEALIDLRRGDLNEGEIGGRETSKEQVGDVVCVKLRPAIWSDKERREFLIVLLEDDALEASIKKDKKVYPYAVYKDKGSEEHPRRVMVNRSERRVDIDMFTGSPGLDVKDTTPAAVTPNGKDMLELSDMVIDISERE